jgi:hypothetical protein
MDADERRPTTLTAPMEVRRRWKDYQIGSKSVAAAIEDLMDQVPPDYLRRDLPRAVAAGPPLSLSEFRRKHRLSDE